MSATDANSGIESCAPVKQAACLECRRSKIKCVRIANANICSRCQTTKAECVIPEYHVGRYKGVKNKRTGLEKAIYQVEQALKRSKSNAVSFDDDDAEVDLHNLVGNIHGSPQGTRVHQIAGQDPRNSIDRSESDRNPITPFPEGPLRNSRPASGESIATVQPDRVDELALDNADNPLQLLAMASALPNQSPSAIFSPSPIAATSLSGQRDPGIEDAELQQFFGSLMPNLDNSPELDPVELGLVTKDEAESLFKYFYDHLSHTRWGLDPMLHTASFVRSRSAFLFTSVLAASATFHSNTTAHAKRLGVHRNRLAQKVFAERYRSVEIVLAFMVNIPWMSPTKHWADDETYTFLSMALTLALDLQLNKLIVPSPTIRPAGVLDRIAKSDCIDANKALQLDGLPQIDPSSPWGRRLLRTRERVWLALFVLDRGICLARGRPYAVPTWPLIDICDTWHICDIADRWDGSIISTAVLRRDLVKLVASIRETCDNPESNVPSNLSPVRFLKDKMDRFFEQWHSVWPRQIGQGYGELPPYVDILVSHTTLSTYCSVINHPTASSDVKQFFRAAGLASAMNVMRAAVQGEERLKSMPNNTTIMVSFAACFALGLNTTKSGDRAVLAPNARTLIEQTTQVLERIGTTPKHRNGTSALFGRHIHRIMQTSFPDPPFFKPVTTTGLDQPSSAQTLELSQVPQSSIISEAPQSQPEPYNFDMTDEEIIEAINNASASQELFQLDEHMFLDWLDWPNTT